MDDIIKYDVRTLEALIKKEFPIKKEGKVLSENRGTDGGEHQKEHPPSGGIRDYGRTDSGLGG